MNGKIQCLAEHRLHEYQHQVFFEDEPLVGRRWGLGNTGEQEYGLRYEGQVNGKELVG